MLTLFNTKVLEHAVRDVGGFTNVNLVGAFDCVNNGPVLVARVSFSPHADGVLVERKSLDIKAGHIYRCAPALSLQDISVEF